MAIAIPVRNEAERIAGCLGAFSDQRAAPPACIVLLLNNCTDDSAGIVRALAPSLRLTIDLCCIDLPSEHAHVGVARSLAMQHAAKVAGHAGIVLTTDADGVAPGDFLAANLAEFGEGADAVMGRIVIDPAEARLIPANLHEDDARECAYAALLDEIASLLDPDPADPWPRHTDEAGASIAVTVAALRRVGGLRPIRSGEDRAFVDTLRRHDLRVRHAPDVRVTVSGRTEGRAPGGMAETIRRRIAAPDLFLDDKLEPVRDAIRRARIRRQLRLAFQSGEADPRLARRLGLDLADVTTMLQREFFGEAWADLEGASPVLRRRRVPAARVLRETVVARAVRNWLLAEDGVILAGAEAPAGIVAAVPA